MGDKEFKRKLRLDQAKAVAKQQKAQIKEQRRAEKSLAREKEIILAPKPVGAVHVACLIHSNGYEWEYVEKLEHMIRRNTSREVIFSCLY